MVDARELTRHIRRKFRIKGPTIAPHVGWLESTREHLAELFADAGCKVGAEVGVRYGEFSEVILRKNPGVTLYSIDTWAPFPGGRPDQAKQERIYRRAVRVLTPLGATIVRKSSMDALTDFQDGSLDFVYVDAMHDFDNAMLDLIGWSKKVRSGGIVSGHDYTNMPECGVIPAVHAYVQGHRILDWYITRDNWHSFFWVKP